MKFRKKPVVVEAVHVTKALVEAHLIDKSPLPDGLVTVRAHYHPEPRIVYSWCGTVVTIHGQQARVEVNDWIIREPDGLHWYPCKPDIFAATYEPVGAEP